MTEEELEAWRVHPVTEWIGKALRKSLKQREDALKANYWAGTPVPDEQRLAVLLGLVLWEDIFQASSADFHRAMQEDNED